MLSHSANKRDDALRLGADDFIATKMKVSSRKMRVSFDFIFDTASVQHDYNAYLNLLKRDGTMVLVGLPDPSPLAAALCFQAPEACRLTDWRHPRDPGNA